MNWFQANARDLPWRATHTTAWQVLVSEIMLQQTPAERVTPAYLAWIKRWPDAATLAQASPADVLRQWDRLGYPNRAMRLHQCAKKVTNEFGGALPSDYDGLVALPGIGDYTASAILAFAHNKRSVVLDTNIRRVLMRVWNGQERQPQSVSAVERLLAHELTPRKDIDAALWSAAVMEFGAVICTARNPGCDHCFIASQCQWSSAGKPKSTLAVRTQKFAGTDRQVRGKLMAVLRDASGSVPKSRLDEVWADGQQRERALDGLVSDSLVEVMRSGRYRLPLN
jgi:A/G-specific adenine glycosylase